MDLRNTCGQACAVIYVWCLKGCQSKWMATLKRNLTKFLQTKFWFSHRLESENPSLLMEPAKAKVLTQDQFRWDLHNCEDSLLFGHPEKQYLLMYLPSRIVEQPTMVLFYKEIKSIRLMELTYFRVTTDFYLDLFIVDDSLKALLIHFLAECRYLLATAYYLPQWRQFSRFYLKTLPFAYLNGTYWWSWTTETCFFQSVWDRLQGIQILVNLVFGIFKRL